MPAVLAASRVATLVGSFPRSPAYRGLADALRALVAEGRVPVGVRLPSERDLSRSLAVSRATVTRAYDLLREERYLESRQGSGSVTRLPVSRAGRTDHLLMVRERASGLPGPSGPSGPDGIDLTIAASGAPPGTFAAYSRALAALPSYVAGTGYYPTGVPALREALAQRWTGRGLPTTTEQVVVVGGALAGLALAAQVLVGPGDRVLVESPTYPNPITTLRSRRARLVTTPVDTEHGWDVAHALAAARGARMAYVIPDFHNPTGALMPSADRERLGRGLTAAGVVPVVDESLVDVRLDDEPLPEPFAVHARDALTLGSASKGFWAGLRIGWIRVPHRRVREVTAARLSLDLASPALEQLALLELLADEESVRWHQRTALRESREAVVAAIARELPDWTVVPARGGLSVWCRLPGPYSTALCVAADAVGVHLAAGPAFAPDGGLDHWLRVPHTLPADTLVEAVRRIATVWPSVLAGRPGPSRRQDEPVVA